MIFWKKITLIVLISIIILFGSLVLLFSTTSGINLLFKTLNHWVPELEIGQVMGSWRDLYLKNIHYQKLGIIVNVGEFHLSLPLNCLRDGQLAINSMFVKDVNVDINLKKIPASSLLKEVDKSSINLSIMYPIVLYQMSLYNVNIKIDNTTISVMHFTSGLHWKDRDLTVMPTFLQEMMIYLPNMVGVTKEKIIKSKIQTNYNLPKKGLGESLKDFFSKPVFPEMIDFYFPLNVIIEEFKGEQIFLTGKSDLTIFKILMKVSTENGYIQLSELDIDTNQGSLNAIGNILLRNDWPVEIILKSNFNRNFLKGEKMTMKLSGGLRDKLKFIVDFSGPINMFVNGKIFLSKVGMPINLEMFSKQLFCPLFENKYFQMHDMKLKIIGKMTDYTLSFYTVMKWQNIPSAIISINAKGSEYQIKFEQFTISMLEGKTDLTAILNWQKSISFRSNLKLSNINIAKEIPDFPLNLNGLIKITGDLYDGNWKVDCPEINLAGNVKSNRIIVNGSIKGKSYLQWVIPTLYVAIGKNTVNINGKLGIEDLDLNVNINTTNLNQVLPELFGTAKGLIKIFGTVKRPKILADITAIGFRWKDCSIDRIRIDSNVFFTEKIGGKIFLYLEKISQVGRETISLVTLLANGTEKKHDFQLYIQSKPISGQLHLLGSLDQQKENWKGKLNSTQLNTTIGLLTLPHSIALEYKKYEQKISIGPHCWINQNVEMCVPKTIEAGLSGNVRINLNRFNLKIIQSFTSDIKTQVTGFFTGKMNITWDIKKEELLKGSATFFGHNVKITKIINKVPMVVEFDILNFNFNLKDNRFQLDCLTKTTNNGEIAGQLQIRDLYGQNNLSGTINIRHLNLAIANIILPKEDNISGLLDANLNLICNKKKFQLFGYIQLNNVNIDNNFIPFDMQPSQLRMNFNGMNLTLMGEVRTQQGQINLIGTADWRYIDNWRAHLSAKGSHIRITIPPMARIDISPNLIFKAKPNLLTIEGRLDVPWARIIVHEIPESTVCVSSDEILLNGKNLKILEQRKPFFLINNNLIVHLGNNVYLDAFGLKTGLTGDLKVSQDKQGIGLNGQINISKGRFHAYGQSLIVRKGELIFSGPLEQPILNIEAIRDPEVTKDNVIAGVRITGSSDEPKAEIFSDPIMSQQEGLSYLLRGEGLNSNQSDGSAMTSMLVRFGVSQTGKVIGKIGETFGVSNLSLDTKGVGDSSQVVLSGYVLPGLQVKYGFRIFDALSTFTLRYRLIPKLYVEAISGINQAIDLLYQFEF